MQLRQFALSATVLGALVVFAAGCASDRGDIPPQAMVMASGDDEITFQAPKDGTVYVLNERSDKMVYSGGINKGETMFVNIDDNQIRVDGRTVLRQDLTHGSKHAVYFLPSPKHDRDPDVIIEKRTRVDNDLDVVIERQATHRDGADVTIKEKTTTVDPDPTRVEERTTTIERNPDGTVKKQVEIRETD